MFLQPHSIAEALAFKAEHAGSAAFVAGGTDLVVLMNHGRSAPRVLIDLSHVPELGTVNCHVAQAGRHTGRLVYAIGGAATFAALAELPVVCLAQAASSVGDHRFAIVQPLPGISPRRRPPATARPRCSRLDAELVLRSASASRRLPVEDFFLDYRKTALAHDELIETVVIPASWKDRLAETRQTWGHEHRHGMLRGDYRRVRQNTGLHTAVWAHSRCLATAVAEFLTTVARGRKGLDAAALSEGMPDRGNRGSSHRRLPRQRRLSPFHGRCPTGEDSRATGLQRRDTVRVLPVRRSL